MQRVTEPVWRVHHPKGRSPSSFCGLVLGFEVVDLFESDMSRAFIYPPRPSQEGMPWGLLIDVYGNDVVIELSRVIKEFGEGWIHYSFLNPATGRNEPRTPHQGHRLGREPGRDQRGDLSPRSPRHVQK